MKSWVSQVYFIFENGQKHAHLHSANAKSPEQVESFLKETFNKY